MRINQHNCQPQNFNHRKARNRILSQIMALAVIQLINKQNNKNIS